MPLPANVSRRILSIAAASHRRGFFVALIGLIIALAAHPADAAGRRVALVVGNAAYQTLPELSNTINDAQAVDGALKAAGFEVYSGVNLKRLEFEELLKRFYRGADQAEIALVYYSGHGVQVGGANYIVPIDAKLSTAYDIELQTLNVDDIFQYLSAHSAAQLIFLDACRTNPFQTQKFWIADTLKTVGANEGLARVANALGSLIAFSTTPGKVAYDGVGGLSPYTTAFIHHVTVPNQEIRQALTQVRRDVIEATGGRQIPWENSSLVDDLYLVRAPAPPAVPPMVRIDVPSDGQSFALNLQAPRQDANADLIVTVDRLPEQGRILLDGKPLENAAALKAADLNRLSFDARGMSRGAVGLMSYVVSDPWKQATRGIVAITIGAEPADAAAAEQAREEARRKALDAAREYLKSVNQAESSATIGVGPGRLGLAAPLDGSPQLEVKSAPDTGALRLGDRTLTSGSRFALSDMSKLAFEPKVGGEGQPSQFDLTLIDSPKDEASIRVTPVLDACDESAASPLDLQGVAAGRLPNEIDAAGALQACRAAVERFPAVTRFVFQLGRAQLASGLAEDARKSFAAAAERKYDRAVAELGSLEQLGAFGPANPAKADGYFAACAASGDAYCLYSHGKALFYGQGVAKDVSRGLALMIRAAELGHTYAMNELGFIFTYGRNIAANPERGIRYYEAGAARNDIYSLNNLGLVYMRGKGRPADLPKALDYFTRSSAGGQPYAPTNLGLIYRDGLGVPVDLEAAAKWLETAAERGDYWGAFNRANLFRDSAGKPRDGVETATYLALAASLNVERGNSDPDKQALRQLAKMSEADKRGALAGLEAKLGAEAAQVKAAALDDRLVELSRRLWQRGKPRFDLF